MQVLWTCNVAVVLLPLGISKFIDVDILVCIELHYL